jgi:pimeloyl-ACP methyl ester carboxylesterase
VANFKEDLAKVKAFVFDIDGVLSLQTINLTTPDAAKATMPVLTIQGSADRIVPYGAGREWAFLLPQARLLTIEGGSHFPWIEAPEKVFGAIRKFLGGQWPSEAEKVTKVDPKS